MRVMLGQMETWVDDMSTEYIRGVSVYYAAAQGPALASEQDALDLLGATYGLGTAIIAVPVDRFAPEFFDLSTRQAGHFFQKMQNYRMRLVILGDISGQIVRSKAFSEFVGEINRIGFHLFAADQTELEMRLDLKG